MDSYLSLNLLQLYDFAFIFIVKLLFNFSDGWADRDDVTRNYEEQAWGGLSIRIHSPYVESFDKYYWSLKPESNIRNPWFKEFWETKFQCILKSRESHFAENVAKSESKYFTSTMMSSDYFEEQVTVMEDLNISQSTPNELLSNYCTGML